MVYLELPEIPRTLKNIFNKIEKRKIAFNIILNKILRYADRDNETKK